MAGSLSAFTKQCFRELFHGKGEHLMRNARPENFLIFPLPIRIFPLSMDEGNSP
jgi:hypothetical protein